MNGIDKWQTVCYVVSMDDGTQLEPQNLPTYYSGETPEVGDIIEYLDKHKNPAIEFKDQDQVWVVISTIDDMVRCKVLDAPNWKQAHYTNRMVLVSRKKPAVKAGIGTQIYWTTHKGQRLPLSKMATTHIFNTLRALYNAYAPPELQVPGKKWVFKKLTHEYLVVFIPAAFKELLSRSDFTPPDGFDAMRESFRVASNIELIELRSTLHSLKLPSSHEQH